MSARVAVALPAILIDGETFQVRPNSRDGTLPVPSVAMPALPLAPVKFSALIERVSALERRERLPIWLPNPSKERSIFASCWLVVRAQFKLHLLTPLSALGSWLSVVRP